MPMDAEIHALAYHPSGLYTIGTGQVEEFSLNTEETFHYDLPREDASSKPHVERGVIRVMHEQTWTVIDEHILDPQEVILCIKTLNLETSEITHQRKDVIAVGTAVLQGEDLATKGYIHIYEVITVVPYADRPETNKRLKLIIKEEVKGAVSAISELGTQGFMIMAQGQKSMVRGLKEDDTLLPVAFMDMQCHITTLKSLPNTGYLLMGDAYKGLWFTGYMVSAAKTYKLADGSYVNTRVQQYMSETCSHKHRKNLTRCSSSAVASTISSAWRLNFSLSTTNCQSSSQTQT